MRINLTLGFAGAYKNIPQKKNPIIIAVDGFMCACGEADTPKTIVPALPEQRHVFNHEGEFM